METKWDAKERRRLARRIIDLQVGQIAELSEKLEITYPEGSSMEAAEEIKMSEHASPNLDFLLKSVDSEETLVKWIEFFEGQN